MEKNQLGLTKKQWRTGIIGVVVVALLAGVYFVNKRISAKNASREDFQNALAEGRKASSDFAQQYPALEQKLVDLRNSKPKQAAKVIRDEIIPMLDRTATAMGASADKGKEFVSKMSEGESGRDKLAANLETISKQRDVMVGLKGIYDQEAKALEVDPPDTEKINQLLTKRIELMRTMVPGGQ